MTVLTVTPNRMTLPSLNIARLSDKRRNEFLVAPVAWCGEHRMLRMCGRGVDNGRAGKSKMQPSPMPIVLGFGTMHT